MKKSNIMNHKSNLVLA